MLTLRFVSSASINAAPSLPEIQWRLLGDPCLVLFTDQRQGTDLLQLKIVLAWIRDNDEAAPRKTSLEIYVPGIRAETFVNALSQFRRC